MALTVLMPAVALMLLMLLALRTVLRVLRMVGGVRSGLRGGGGRDRERERGKDELHDLIS